MKPTIIDLNKKINGKYQEHIRKPKAIKPKLIDNQYASGKGRPTGWSRTRTLELVRQGLTISQIAHIRDCVESTIEGHIAELIGLGMLNLDNYVGLEDQRKVIPTVMKLREKTLTEIKTELPDSISWGTIRMVKAFVEKNITK